MNRVHGVSNSALTVGIGAVRIGGAGVMLDPPAVTTVDHLIAWIEAR